MNLDQAGQEIYQRLLSELKDRPDYSESLHDLLSQYVFALQQSEKLADEIATEGATILFTNKAGHTNTMSNPKVRMFDTLNNSAVRIARELGLTPKARKALKLSSGKAKAKGFNLDGKMKIA